MACQLLGGASARPEVASMAQGSGQRRAKRLTKQAHEAGSRLGEAARAVGELGATSKQRWLSVQVDPSLSLPGLQSALSPASASLSSLHCCMASATEHAAKAERCMQHASEFSDSLSSAVGQLHASVAGAATRAHAAGELIRRCRLSYAQQQALQSAAPDSPEFFAALQAAGSARAQCRSLLRVRHRQVLVDLLDELATLRESALERLGRWCQSHVRALLAPDGGASEPDEEGLQRYINALQALKSRPPLYNAAADAAATARRDANFKRFVLALTRGEPSNPKARPLETRADEQPAKFVAEMLGHIHQAAASERDFANSLFESSASNLDTVDSANGNTRGRDGASAIAANLHSGESQSLHSSRLQQQEQQTEGEEVESKSDEEQTFQWDADTFVAKATEGLVRPFKARAEQALQEAGADNASIIQSTIDLYASAICGLTGRDSTLAHALQALSTELDST